MMIGAALSAGAAVACTVTDNSLLLPLGATIRNIDPSGIDAGAFHVVSFDTAVYVMDISSWHRRGRDCLTRHLPMACGNLIVAAWFLLTLLTTFAGVREAVTSIRRYRQLGEVAMFGESHADVILAWRFAPRNLRKE